MTEVEHIQRLFRRTTLEKYVDRGWVLRPWRGLVFYGGTRHMDVYAYAPSAYLHKIDGMAWENMTAAEMIVANAVTWARSCQQRPSTYKTLNPVDNVPWEIHAIEDFDAYMSALEAYRTEVSA